MAEDSIINEKGELKGLGVLLTAEGMIMMPIAVIFDIATFICAIFIIFYGIGYVAGIIVDVVAFCAFTLWSSIRSQIKKAMTVETEESSGGEEESEHSLPQQPEREAGKEEASKAGKTGQAGEETLKTGKTGQAGAEALKAEEEATKGGEEAAKVAKTATTASRAARFAKWGKIITPIKNAVPWLGLIPSWWFSTYFELQPPN